MKKFLLSFLCLMTLFAASAQTDKLTAKDNFSGISYSIEKSYTSPTTGAVYKAKAASNNGFQIRSSKQGIGITVATAPNGKIISSITISITTAGSGANIYAGSTPMSLTETLSNPVASAVKTTQTIDINAPYFAIKPAGDSFMVISELSVTWVSAGPVDYEPGFQNVELMVGDTHTLNLGAKHPAEMIFDSSDKSVATISEEGVISAVKEGSTTITCMWDADDNFNAGEAEFTVTVTPKVKVVYAPDFQNVTITEGSTLALELGENHPVILFESSNENVATIDDNGVITALTVGETTISCLWGDADYEDGDAEFTVTVTERPLVYSWSITGVETEAAATVKADTDLKSAAAEGVWHFTSTDNCYAATDQGAHLGSGKSTVSGTLVLSGLYFSDYAVITKVEMSAKVAKDAEIKWNISVDDVTADNCLTFNSTDVTTVSADVNLRGNNIVLTCVSATEKKAIYITGITVYYKIACPYDEEELTPEFTSGTTTLGENNQIKIEIPNNDLDGVKIYYKHVPAPTENKVSLMSVDHADFTEATHNAETGNHEFTIDGAGQVTYYGYHEATDTKGIERKINVLADGTTGVESVEVDGKDAEVEYFNLQGVRVENPAAGGLYIRKQGSKVTKVIL